MTDRWPIRGVPIPLQTAILLTLPDHPHKIRIIVEGQGHLPIPTEIGLESYRCIDRQNDTWLIEGTIIFCADVTKFQVGDHVRAIASHKKQKGEIRRIKVLSQEELAAITIELDAARQHPEMLPDELLDITRWLTGDVALTLTRWVKRHPELALEWYERRRLITWYESTSK
jgi:hypothetical protein